MEEKEKEKTTTDDNKEEKDHTAKMASLAIFVLVLLLFLGVLFITYFFEVEFGKTAGTIALVVIAAIIAVYLYRKEIIDKFKNK